LRFPVFEELAGPGRVIVVPELPERFLLIDTPYEAAYWPLAARARPVGPRYPDWLYGTAAYNVSPWWTSAPTAHQK
jgi:hypothetical protein